MSLYTKYRPKDWDSVVGQDFIVTILRSSLQNNKTGHAYIFTGSRGTGKTTSARIFAKALNCTNLQNGNPCHECNNCRAFDEGNMMDIIEIDGASNTSVNDVRDLIEKAKFEPTMWKYKIYIIDEVHMLSDGAFNALLKTIEEPPMHVKFILATTEIHKVPETIQSRSHRFDFQKIPQSDIIKRLDFICQSENISTEEKSLEIIAKMARGWLRDAITLLEQYTINSQISVEHLQKSLSLVDENFLENILENLKTKNIDAFKKSLEILKTQHIDAQNFFDQMLLSLRDKLFENIWKSDFLRYEQIFQVFRDAYSSLRSVTDNIILLEITLLQAFSSEIQKEISPVSIKQTQPTPRAQEEKIAIKKEEIPIKKETSQPISKQAQNIAPEKTIESSQDTKIKEDEPHNTTSDKKNEFNFRQLLTQAKAYPVVLAALKTASFKQKDNFLQLFFTSNWNFTQMNDAKNKTALIQILEQTFGGKWEVSLEFKPHNIDSSFADDIF